jgi:hypothetical protein
MDFSAIRPGTDLPSYARQLVRMHDAVIGGAPSRLRPRDLVARSWSRVLGDGLDPGVPTWCDPLPLDVVHRRRRESPLSLVIDDLRQIICSVADACQFLMVVTDADGVILWREGSARVRAKADSLGFAEGAEWTEQRVGTNAIGTALAEANPVQLFSAEHFQQQQHPWYCTAAPMHDPRTGELLGIVDVSGPALTLHPAILALVQTAVRFQETQLRSHHRVALEALRTAAHPLLATVGGPLLLVDDEGWVAHAAGVAAPERIAAPRADRPVTLPGLGLCTPERVAGGWLVRPTGRQDRIVVDLDLSARPSVEVSGGDRQWQSTLTSRHAEILGHLHTAGPAGLSAADLSRLIYGDAGHVVSVRAEVSRLRRTLGGIVESQPYRISPSVEVRLRQPA